MIKCDKRRWRSKERIYPAIDDLSGAIEFTMQLGIIGLGRMGANIERRLVRGGNECVVFEQSPQKVTDLVLDALTKDSQLSQFAGRVSDSGEGRRTVKAAIDEGVPVPVLPNALDARFASHGEAHFQDKVLSAMRYGLGGHQEKSPE